MSKFHAGFSLGTVGRCGCQRGGRGRRGQRARRRPSSRPPCGGVGLVVGTRMFTPFERRQARKPEKSRSLLLKAWTNPRTLIVGLMVLAFAFTEGVANDWTAVAFVDGLGTSEATGAIGFAVFVAAMTPGRLVGGTAIDRWGRVLVLRGSALLAASAYSSSSTGRSSALAMVGSRVLGVRGRDRLPDRDECGGRREGRSASTCRSSARSATPRSSPARPSSVSSATRSASATASWSCSSRSDGAAGLGVAKARLKDDPCSGSASLRHGLATPGTDG